MNSYTPGYCPIDPIATPFPPWNTESWTSTFDELALSEILSSPQVTSQLRIVILFA